MRGTTSEEVVTNHWLPIKTSADRQMGAPRGYQATAVHSGTPVQCTALVGSAVVVQCTVVLEVQCSDEQCTVVHGGLAISVVSAVCRSISGSNFLPPLSLSPPGGSQAPRNPSH